MTCCTTPLPAHTEVNCQLISITVPSSSGVMHAYSSPLLLHMFCFPPCLFFALLPPRSLLLLDFPLSLVFCFVCFRPHPFLDRTVHITPLVNTYPSTSPPPQSHTCKHTHAHTHTSMWCEFRGQSDIGSDLLWTQQGPCLTLKAAVWS